MHTMDIAMYTVQFVQFHIPCTESPQTSHNQLTILLFLQHWV